MAALKKCLSDHLSDVKELDGNMKVRLEVGFKMGS